MRLVTEPAELPSPLLAVLEVSGAVLSWLIDDPSGPDDPAATIIFTDAARADWLWRVVGQPAHLALVDVPAGVTGVDVVPGSLDPLRRLAIGHWLRRWWPASQRDGIPGLDRTLLDVEVALLTVRAQNFFTDDTLDSDVTGLLAPHAAALTEHLRTDDSRVRDLVRAGSELAGEMGVDGVGWPELAAAVDDSSLSWTMPTGRRDDYALAAGVDTGPRGGAAMGQGVASISWGAVPPGIFDAAEDTVAWSVRAAGPVVVAVVQAAVLGAESAADIAVQVGSGHVSGAGSLDAGGHAEVPLLDAQQQALTESAAWNHDWPMTSVVVGAPVDEPREVRDRIRRWVRTRLDQPPQDAFLAETLAAESSY